MSITRRGFLGVLLASPILAKTVAASLTEPEQDASKLVTAGTTQFASGYDKLEDTTWLRVSVQLPNGREWHCMVCGIGDHRWRQPNPEQAW